MAVKRRLQIFFTLCLIVFLGLLGGTWILDPDRPPDIVLIVMDTVRKDHLSSYGYEKPTSPFLEELSKDSRVYENAYAPSCWTIPSHASIFTGRYPSSHGAHWENLHLDEDLATLAELLAEKGYRTIGITENHSIGTENGFSQGFHRYIFADVAGRGANHVLNIFDSQLSRKGNEPLFVFVNFIAAHTPYNSSRQFFGSFLSDPSYMRKSLEASLARYIVGKLTFTEKDLKHLAEHYDAEVRYVDYLVEGVVGSLKKHGLWDDTLFIVTSDHGENLGEHGLLKHQLGLYETTSQVPLIIHYPERFPPGSSERAAVQLIDIFPTVLEIARVDGVPGDAQAVSLLPGRPLPDRAVLGEYFIHAFFTEKSRSREFEEPVMQKHKRRLKSILVGSMKYIWASKGKKELYNLELDPSELNNLIDDGRYDDVRATLERKLDEKVAALQKHFRRTPLDRKTREALRALGYIR